MRSIHTTTNCSQSAPYPCIILSSFPSTHHRAASMNNYHRLLLAWLLLNDRASLVDGFATAKQRDGFAATKISSNRRIECDAKQCDDDLIVRNDGDSGEVGRREFFVSMVGAASVLALSEEATASTRTESTHHGHQPKETSVSGSDGLSSELLSAGAAQGAVATVPPAIDTRAIFGKAAKKALGGGKGKCVYQ